MNYYIQGDAANADKIRAAFKKLGYNTYPRKFTNEYLLYFTLDGKIRDCTNGEVFAKIIKSHPDYQELELPVEPIFKAGDWIASIDDEGGVAVERIVNLRDNKVLLVDTDACYTEYPKTALRNFHLWTIADAKDGDVLMCESGWTCIFKKLNEDTFDSYCFMSASGDIVPDGSCCHTLDPRINGKLTPTTVEQRILFFKKLQEAGYQWDADKKELNYDISNFSAGMPVLVRDRNFEEWTYALFSHYKGDRGDYKFSVTGSVSRQCVPFNKDTKHLLGTTDMCDEQYINW